MGKLSDALKIMQRRAWTVWVAALLSWVCLGLPLAQAQQYTFPYVFDWTGAGGSNLWSDQDNWVEVSGNPNEIGYHKVDNEGIIEFKGDVRPISVNDKLVQEFAIRFDSSTAFVLNPPASAVSGNSFQTLNLASRGVTSGQALVNGNPYIQNLSSGVATINFSINFLTAAGDVPVVTSEIDATGGSIRINGNVAITNQVSSLNFNGSGSNVATVNGVISGDQKNLTVGGGTASLLGSNTYTGSTTVFSGILDAAAHGALGSTGAIAVNSGGTLRLSGDGNIGRLNEAAGITLSGGTVQKMAGASEGTTGIAGFGALTLTQNSTIDFTSSEGTLTFAGFTPSSSVLSIINYIRTNSPGGADQLIFNGDQSSNLAHFNFGDGPGVNVAEANVGGTFFEVYPVTAVPEAPTWGIATLCLLAVLPTRVRKIRVLVTKYGKSKVSRSSE